MGKIWMPGGGGGADLDVVTAGTEDVLAGKVIVGKAGEPLTGTMVNRGAVSQALGVNGIYTIPEGYHNGSGKVMQNIPIQGADITGTDRALSQGMSNWAGTINLKVRNGHYLNGVNWIQQNVPEYQPWNIKKGVNIGGVVGTFEGYVPTSTDIYLRGNNVMGISAYANGGAAPAGAFVFESGQITVSKQVVYDRWLGIYLNLTGYSYVNAEIYRPDGSGTFRICVSSSNNGIYVYDNAELQNYSASANVVSLNVSALNASRWTKFSSDARFFIYRLWLS
jgi:hypothetical protein